VKILILLLLTLFFFAVGYYYLHLPKPAPQISVLQTPTPIVIYRREPTPEPTPYEESDAIVPVKGVEDFSKGWYRCTVINYTIPANVWVDLGTFGGQYNWTSWLFFPYPVTIQVERNTEPPSRLVEKDVKQFGLGTFGITSLALQRVLVYSTVVQTAVFKSQFDNQNCCAC